MSIELELEDVSNEVSSFVMNFVGGYLGTYVHILMCCSGRNSIGISKNIGLENISILLIVWMGLVWVQPDISKVLAIDAFSE